MPPPREPSDSPSANALAIAAGTAAAVAPPAAAGGVGAAGTFAAALAAKKLIENSTKAILAVSARLSRMRLAKARKAITSTVDPGTDIHAVLSDEIEREKEFKRRAEVRVKTGMKLALAASDPSARASGVEGIVRREQHYSRLRAQAAGERLFASIERTSIREISPKGAYWELGPTSVHTPDCVAMAGKFWPWEILDRLRIPMHTGCKCRLRSYGEALGAGLLVPSAVPSLEEARRMAAHVESWVEKEKALENRAVAELLIREELLERGAADPNVLAALPLAVEADLEEAEANTGAMVALFPDPADAVDLAVKGGEPADELHVTLAFLGAARGKPKEKALAAVAAWAKKTPPLKGETSGVGYFDVGKETCTYRSVSLPDLAAAREVLVKALDKVGAPARADHGFSPHMTVDYRYRKLEVEKAPITFKSVTLAWGDERHSFPLGGDVKEGEDVPTFASEVARRLAAVEAVMIEDEPEPEQ